MQPSSSASVALSRRTMLAGAAALAGTTAAMAATASSAQATAPSHSEAAVSGAAGRRVKAVVFRNVRPFGVAKPTDLVVVDGRVASGPAPRGA